MNNNKLNIILAGPPASGKGTMCAMIKEKLHCIHISTGDILRKEISDETPLGVEAATYMNEGNLVPDELITSIVLKRISKSDCIENGYLLDGFPRTLSQAQTLITNTSSNQEQEDDNNTPKAPHMFICLTVPDDIIVQRVSGRLLDPETNEIYHSTNNPPPSDEIRDRCIHRPDDTEEKIRVRLNTYYTQINEISSCFTEILHEVDGSGTPNEVWERLEVIFN